MIDTVLLERESKGQPIRVGMVGAGLEGRAIALQLGSPVPGIRLFGIANRTLQNGEKAFSQAGIAGWGRSSSPSEAEKAIGAGNPVLTDDPSVLIACDAIDVIIEVTGTIDFAAETCLAAFQHGKHVVLVNAELDSLLGPILKAKADRAGVVLTHTDGDEPGVAMTLLRYLRSVGLRPVAAGNLKGMVDHYRTPETQRPFAEKYGLNPKKASSFADATKLSMEATVLANATGFQVGRRGMYGPACKNVQEMGQLLPADQMLNTGLVDYALGAAPYTGAFVVVYEDSALKRVQLEYYKLGDGPFYVFYTPYHLPHVQIASTIARAFIDRDATIASMAGPICEVITVAKRNLKTGEGLDGVGGFCAYGLIENTAAAREMAALPIGLSEGSVLTRDIGKDQVISFSDVSLPPDRISDRLWNEQAVKWPHSLRASPVPITR
jgi:predicted homoserine dehydrogenase-like protein